MLSWSSNKGQVGKLFCRTVTKGPITKMPALTEMDNSALWFTLDQGGMNKTYLRL